MDILYTFQFLLFSEMRDEYEKIVWEAEHIDKFGDAVAGLREAQADLYEAQVWFWRWRSPHSEIVPKKLEVVAEHQAKVNELDAQRQELLRKANSVVGLWSEYGMQDVRQRFWTSFEGGKVFAKRQTFWQMFYTLFNTKENVASIFLEWIMIALLNFTLGLIGSLFYFMFSLGNLIFSYNSDPFTGLAFFLISLLGGASVVATYLLGIYGLGAGGVYVIGKVALRGAAIKYEEEQRRLRERRQM
jgi:hypothetical protein